jgi:Holliday junction resolvasome RuvABC ATP-dependent DNA helicase subunit
MGFMDVFVCAIYEALIMIVHFHSYLSQIETDKRRKRVLRIKSFHALFIGNFHTGKRDVARLYACMLKEVGVLADDIFVRTSGDYLVKEGSEGLEKFIKKLEKGGVLFIEVAHKLGLKDNLKGAEASIHM